jgi:glycosyltransferase involved in cell wall biosynthesis
MSPDPSLRNDPSLVFAISADYARQTGGWIYDQRLLGGLRRLGWVVDELTLPAGFPAPDPEARAASAEALRALPTGTLLLTDQLCLGVLPEVAIEQQHRLRQVMIVHHPLALEGDVPAAASARAEAERTALAHVALVVATSEATAQCLRDEYAVPSDRLIVAPPGVDRLPLSTGVGDGTIRLLSVGSVVPRKDHGLLIEALAGLADRPWRLRIAGDLARASDHVAALRARLEELGLEDRVDLAGGLEGEPFEALWREADLYVASSRHEGFGMAVAEAVARGLPIVTTTAGAVEGWLDRRAALIVPVGDMQELRRALARVLDEPELRRRLQEGARAATAALPSWDAAAATVHAALGPLLERRPG